MSSPTTSPVRAPAPTRTRDGLAVARRALSSQAGRFLLVGGVATVVDVGLFNVFDVLVGLDPVLSKVLSTALAAVVAFVGNRQWSFAAGSARPLSAQVGPYVVITLVSLGIAVAPVEVAKALGHEGVVTMNLAANVLGLGLATAFRFYSYRLWVFPSPAVGRDAEPREVPAEVLRRAA